MRSLTRLVACLLMGLPAAALGQATPTDVDISPDTTVSLTGVTVNDEDVANDDFINPVVPAALGGLPASTDLTGYVRLNNGDQLFSVDTTVALGAIVADRADVVRYSTAGVYSLEFDASANGVPAGAMVDAIAQDIDAGGLLQLSFDTTVALPGGVVADDEDLVSWNPGAGTYALVFDGSANGVATSLDLDGAYALFSTGRYWLSFDGSGSVGAVAAFDDEDLLEFNPVGPVWTLVYDGSVNHAALAASDVDAVHTRITDTDLDGILDDGDGSGIVGDNPCSCQAPNVPVGCAAGCDDNCTFRANTTQLDVGGVQSPQFPPGPDGIGDVCQCGDMNADGVVNSTDVVLYRRYFAGLLSPFSTDRCSVVGPNGICDSSDVVIMRRTFAGLLVGIVTQSCSAALGLP